MSRNLQRSLMLSFFVFAANGCGTDLTKYDLAYLTCGQGLGFDQGTVDGIWLIFADAKVNGLTFEDAAIVGIRVCENACGNDSDCLAACHACMGVIAEGVYNSDGSGPTGPRGFKFPLDGKFAGHQISGYHFGDWWESKTCSIGDQKVKMLHTGADFAATSGSSVYAVADGVLKYAETDTSWGGYVVIEHNGQYTTTYTHVTPTSDLKGKSGLSIKRGQKIATIYPGITGKFGPHLHFQARDTVYGNLSFRGALPEEKDCGGNPAFPERFVDPERLGWEK